MENIDKIIEEISKGYELVRTSEVTSSVTASLSEHAGSLGLRARSYVRAAAVLEQDGFQHSLATSQLFGHAVELALKACLAAAGLEPPHNHNLIELYRTAEQNGFNLENREIAAIVHLHHIYFQDLSSQTRYKARYPTRENEPVGGLSPTTEVYGDIVESLLSQSVSLD